MPLEFKNWQKDEEERGEPRGDVQHSGWVEASLSGLAQLKNSSFNAHLAAKDLEAPHADQHEDACPLSHSTAAAVEPLKIQRNEHTSLFTPVDAKDAHEHAQADFDYSLDELQAASEKLAKPFDTVTRENAPVTAPASHDQKSGQLFMTHKIGEPIRAHAEQHSRASPAPLGSDLRLGVAGMREQTPQKATLNPFISPSQTFTPQEQAHVGAELRSNEVISKSSVKSNRAAFRQQLSFDEVELAPHQAQEVRAFEPVGAGEVFESCSASPRGQHSAHSELYGEPNSNSYGKGSQSGRRNQKLAGKLNEKAARQVPPVNSSALAQKRLMREQMNEMAAQSFFGVKKAAREEPTEQRFEGKLAAPPSEEVDSKNSKTEFVETNPEIQQDEQAPVPVPAAELPQMTSIPAPVPASAPRANSKPVQRSEQPVPAVLKREAESKTSTGKATGRWTKEEHFRFLEALKLYGKEWKKVQQHVGTRSSTQARSHAQKFFVKLDKKQQTMEQFLEQLDMSNLKQSLMEHDSEYGDESDKGATVHDMLSVSAASHSAVQNNPSKSADRKYRRQSTKTMRPAEPIPCHSLDEAGLEWPGAALHGSAQENVGECASYNLAGISAPRIQQKKFQEVSPDKIAVSTDVTAGHPSGQVTSIPIIANQDTMSTQCTQTLANKVTHKTPQLKPSVANLAIGNSLVPDTFSNDDKPQNDNFALPLVGQRRRPCDAGLPKSNQLLKRMSVQPHPAGKQALQMRESRPEQHGAPPVLPMKRTKSDYMLGLEKPFTQLFEQRQVVQSKVGGAEPVKSNFAAQDLTEDLQAIGGSFNYLPLKFDDLHRQASQHIVLTTSGLKAFQQQSFQLPNGLANGSFVQVEEDAVASIQQPNSATYPPPLTSLLMPPQQSHQTEPLHQINAIAEAPDAEPEYHHANTGLAKFKKDPIEFEALHVPQGPGPAMQMLSQTPRIKASQRRSPILMATASGTAKKANSLLGQDMDAHLSQQRVLIEDSPPMDHETSLLQQDDWNIDFGNEPGINNAMLRPEELNNGMHDDAQIFADLKDPYPELAETQAAVMRHRSMTFNVPKTLGQHDFDGLLDDKHPNDDLSIGNRQPRLSFDLNEGNHHDF